LSDIRSCFEFVGREKLTLDAARIAGLPLDQASSSCRAFLYAVLELNRGKLKRAMGFIKQAREQADAIDELAYVLHVEAVLLSLMGDWRRAIARQLRCVQICKLTGNKHLGCDALLHLSSLYLKLGEPAVAEVYEKEAALMMPRDGRRV